MIETKICESCKIEKPVNEFYFNKIGMYKGKPMRACKSCNKLTNKLWRIKNHEKIIKTNRITYAKNKKENLKRCKKWRIANPNKVIEQNHKWTTSHPGARNEWKYKTGRSQPMSKNKKCSKYLGVYIAENILSNFFEGLIRMPHDNPGYDFICKKGFKIDVKSSCLYYGKIGNPHWMFRIDHNNTTDYFLCISFDDRTNLTPLHVWLIPGNIINKKSGLTITDSQNSLSKWSQYEKPLDKVNVCCSIMKAEVST